ncbi:unnamed protein product [Pylaiella littoralis]
MRARLGSAAGFAALILVALLADLAAVHSREEGLRDAPSKQKRKPFQRAPGAPARTQVRYGKKNKRDKMIREEKQDEQPPPPPPKIVVHECPYVIDSEESAMARINDTSLPGNVVTIEHLTFCRTGNHFISLLRNLALGYCCKSRVVWLPPKDDVLAPGIFNEGTPGSQFFDFSDAPDTPGFDSSSCSADITWAGARAFRMQQLEDPDHDFHTPGLLRCINSAPRLLGCEAEYYFPRGVDLCPAATSAAAAADPAPPILTFADGLEHEVQRSDQGGWHVGVGTRPSGGGWDATVRHHDGGGGDKGAVRHGKRGAGNLVLHVRSGDIFSDKIIPYYGQPPLQFYLEVIRDAEWDRVDVVTSAPDEESLNPVIPALQAKLAAGELPQGVHIHTNRTLGEDLQAMICADSLAMAGSTLRFLTGWHSKATRIYAPSKCTPKVSLHARQREGIEVFGSNMPSDYSVFEIWENTPEQRSENEVLRAKGGGAGRSHHERRRGEKRSTIRSTLFSWVC